jgi:DNA-binding transcriptional LysR family regulator
MTQVAKVKLLAPPVELPTYAVKQHWHERYHHDPAVRWLRGVFAELFAERRAVAAERSAHARGAGPV